MCNNSPLSFVGDNSKEKLGYTVCFMSSPLHFLVQTLLECVRLRTFGNFGLQQIQVDCHYLQMYLWTYVSDERWAVP